MRKRCLMVGMTMLAAMAARGAEQAEKPAGAKTVEEAVEMFATAFEKRDTTLLAAVVDDSTATGKELLEFVPTLMEGQDAFEKFDQALIKKFGQDKRKEACHIHFPNPAEGIKTLRALAKDKKGKWEDARVEITNDKEPGEPMVFVKNAAGIWHFSVPGQARLKSKAETEGLKNHLKMLKKFCEEMHADLEKYRTPEECAKACERKMGDLKAEAWNKLEAKPPAQQHEKPIGAKTAEEAVEMLAKAYAQRDMKLMAALIDDSTEAGKKELAIMPAMMEYLDAGEPFDRALLEKFGADNRDKACRIRIPNPTEIAKVYVDLAKEKKGKWGENRVEIAMGNDKASLSKALVLEKGPSGFWRICFPKNSAPASNEQIENIKKQLKVLKKFCEDMRADLEKYKTPEECAEACDRKMEDLVADAVKGLQKKETAPGK